MKKIKVAIFDFKRTLYDPEKDKLLVGAKKILQFLKNKNISLFLIGKGDSSLKRKVEKLGIADYFEEMIFRKNKTPVLFKKILKKTGCQGDNCLAIGDRVKVEIKIGNLLKMQTVWLKTGKFATEAPVFKNETPCFIISKLSGIYKLVKRGN